MNRKAERHAAALLRALSISSDAGTVVLDETRSPTVFVVYVFDEALAEALKASISEWKGHPVEIVRSRRPSTHLSAQ